MLQTRTFPLAALTAVHERWTAVTTYEWVPSGAEESVQLVPVMSAAGLLPQAGEDVAPVMRVT
jgi:hypothetical protein